MGLMSCCSLLYRKVPNPQIALALIRRSLSAQLDIAKAIGATPEPIVADML